ncbi:hypothetical protein MCY_00067 [Bartonella rattimassiliensis 15908]|uniref:Uncharacterized protein n=1 Tax=Bartonella rattimassiliensis 15908 TaxID=1094556 RepID=J0QPT6_9HYPH|nr:hypothetical protein MCY_00067 [Bartonella rattimassiliensis 15908]
MPFINILTTLAKRAFAKNIHCCILPHRIKILSLPPFPPKKKSLSRPPLRSTVLSPFHGKDHARRAQQIALLTHVLFKKAYLKARDLHFTTVIMKSIMLKPLMNKIKFIEHHHFYAYAGTRLDHHTLYQLLGIATTLGS